MIVEDRFVEVVAMGRFGKPMLPYGGSRTCHDTCPFTRP